MKHQLLLLFIGVISLNSYSQTFQKDLSVPNNHFTDLNTIVLKDGTNDYIIAGSLWDATFGTSILSLTRIDDVNGTVVWNKTYTDANLLNFRAFDITRFEGVNMQEKIAMTGSFLDPSTSFTNTMIAIFDANTGNFTNGQHFDISINNLSNSQGLHLIYTEKNNVAGVPTPGFVVGGFITGGLASNVAMNQTAFVLRVDIDLNQEWLILLDGGTAQNYDYDVVNHIVETSNGYFLTGGKTIATSTYPFVQEGVLATKIDENGVQLWEQSYLFGNNIDNGVDTYYDSTSEEIYLLTNYSVTHTFGITVLDNISGTINYSKSWVSAGPFLNINGFKLSETQDTDTLVIHGYIRDYNINIDDPNGVLTSTPVQATPFVYSFDKVTSNQVFAYTYNVPFNYPTGFTDFFKFFNGQFPVAYYPDMALFSSNTNTHFSVAYRNRNSTLANMEMIKTTPNLRNDCENDLLTFTHNSIAVTNFTTNLISYSANATILNLTTNTQDYIMTNCDGTAKVENYDLDKLNIYPNPVKDIIFITSNSDIKNYKIYDVLGKLVHMEISSSSIEQVSVSKLKIGIYFIKVTDEANMVKTAKFIKE